jgi:DNA-binding NarL/FixJ family response regulator
MNIFIADDHQFIIESLEYLINKIEGYQISKTFNNGVDLLACLDNGTALPDLVLTDYQMPLMNGIELTYQIRQKYPSIKVILLTVSEDVTTIEAAFKAGISGYVMKKAGKNEIELALNTVAAGKKYYSESVISELINRDKPVTELAYEPIDEKLSQLSEREIEIIRLIARELSTNEIAEKLFISVGTVESHRHNIFRKLNIKNSIGLVKFALKNGIV